MANIQVVPTTLKKQKPNAPKSIVIFFLIYQIFFGINFGFGVKLKKRLRIFAEYLPLFVTKIFRILLLVPALTFYHSISFWFTFLEYSLYTTIANRSKYVIYNLVEDMYNVHKLTSTEENMLKVLALLYTSVTYLIKAGFLLARCFFTEYCSNIKVPYFTAYCFSSLCVDVIGVMESIMFYYIYCSVKSLKNDLVRPSFKMEFVVKKYKGIAECYEKIRPLYENFTMIDLFLGVPKMILFLWCMLLDIQKNVEFLSYMNDMIYVLHILIQMCIPALVAELINSEVDKIKLILSEHILVMRDEEKVLGMSKLLRYMKARPLRHLVWRFIPVDSRQLLALFSICTSYFIVIIQFTHLYD